MLPTGRVAEGSFKAFDASQLIRPDELPGPNAQPQAKAGQKKGGEQQEVMRLPRPNELC